MTTVYKYRFVCIEENIHVTSWGIKTPTLCPNDHPNRQINTNSISVVETVNENTVIVKENTTGYFETDQTINVIPEGTPGTVTTYDIQWDSDIILWRVILSCSNDMIGDEIKVIAGPEMNVGLTTSPVYINDSIIHVEPLVASNVYRGCELVLFDGTNKHTTVVTAVDKNANTMTIKNPSPYNYATGALVKIGIFLVKYFKFHDTNDLDIGLKGLRGSEIPKGMIVRIYYTNNNGLGKSVYWRTEYYNDD